MKTYLIENEFLQVEVLSLGATLLSFKHKHDKVNILVRHFDDTTYLEGPGAYLGSCIGPCAGRTAGGKFGEYQLVLNSQTNHLHGGPHGVHAFDFDCVAKAERLVFSGTIDHSVDGYPGKIHYVITYTLDGETLILEMEARPEYQQHINMTNHAYFNLEGSDSIKDHSLEIKSKVAGIVDDKMEFRGDFADITGTVLDFRSAPLLKKVTEGIHPVFALTRNLDQTYPVNTLQLQSQSKTLSVKTDAPGIHVYAANYFDESFLDEKGRKAKNHAALAIEPQGPSNEINYNENYPVYSIDRPFTWSTQYTLQIR